MIVVVCKYL